MDLDRLAAVHLFPVRHHSPRSSATLRAYLDEVRPKAIFVEGPSDATPLLEALVDPKTVPPVAILGYRTDGEPASSLWPFAAWALYAWRHGLTRPHVLIPLLATALLLLFTFVTQPISDGVLMPLAPSLASSRRSAR